ncbi:FkbM family methyltransferase [Halopolyspora algeriensis]|uniref:FkbM family methyltransferase n=1 Tax=Halopolyspora algeriensis TaxID=1500506 RepID=A0A368VK58_9ACTN|nr:FkbM family methyltransferase [Halopolyspora algeriensis]RCW40677.1 FkbM family methyltransferase [Halopolyspora algeriensis]TQM53400.1 FkbM family methyltransferase [Halopolyspora algeriensis]
MTDDQVSDAPSGEPSEPTLGSRPAFAQQSEGRPDEPEWPPETSEETAGGSVLPAAPLLGCTVAYRSQLPAARVLCDSFLDSHPGARFVILLLDDTEDSGDQERAEVLTPRGIGVESPEFARLAMACTPGQLRAVLRPRLLAHLLQDGACVLALEPCVRIFGGFEDVVATLTPSRPVALVPRVLHPLPADSARPNAADLAESGTFDPNMLAVGPGGERFLAAWAEQSRADPTTAFGFLENASALVDHQVLRDPGFGVSAFNAAQRTLESASDGRYLVDGHVLRTVHFDGFDPQRPWLLSAVYADQPRVLLSEHPVLARLCAGYRNALMEAGHTRQQSSPFETLPDGTVVPAALRTAYRYAWWEAERVGEDVPVSPFELPRDRTDAVSSFLQWACAAENERQREAGASRWTVAVWSDDPVLQRTYPDPLGVDATAFREWCAGAADNRIPSAAVHRTAGDRRAPMIDQLGVAVLGKGRVAELVRATVRASGLPSADTPHYPVVLRCDTELPVPAGHYVIDILPEQHSEQDTAPSTDNGTAGAETWVLSEAGRLRGDARTHVITLPLPESDPMELPTRRQARAECGLADEFAIAGFVDHADEQQGNTLGLVNAFLTAFPDRSDVRLLLAVSEAVTHPEEAERLRLATTTDPRIVLLEDISQDRVLAASDCVASLHRAEGGTGGDRYVLRLLEAVAQAIPVVAGDHGAVAEVLDEQCAKLVPCHSEGEPDIGTAAALLAGVAEAPDKSATFGLAAREHLLAEYSMTRAAEGLRERVEQAYRNWRVHWSGDRHDGQDDPLRPLLIARHALHRPPEVGVGGRHSMAPALRKAVLKALGHYDEHIREIMRSLVDGVEQTAAELLRRQSDTGEDLDVESLRAELTHLGQRQDRLGAQLAGTEDGIVRARADLAEHHRRLREVEEGLASERGGDDDRVGALAERLDRLTGAVEKTLDRIDSLEREWAEAQRSREHTLEAGLQQATHDADHALHRTDILQRIVLREHERTTSTGDDTGTPVVCDAGLMRLPDDDTLMLPWLSSRAHWDREVSTLIDGLLEPEGIFLDIGAYVGYQAVRVLSRMGTTGAVVAVEPCERSRQLLWRNMEVNVPERAEGQLTVLGSTAWDTPDELAVERSTSGGLHVRADPASHGGVPEESAKVQATRLDWELENQPALSGLRLSVVHVDVGSRVHRILRGLVRLLQRDRPSVVCSFTPTGVAELSDDPAAALREFGTWGYELVPVGRSEAVSAEELLKAIGAAGSASTVKLWLRPRQ